MDTFLDGLSDNEENSTRRPQEIQDELQSVIRLPVRLSADQLRDLRDDPRELEEPVKDQIETDPDQPGCCPAGRVESNCAWANRSR